MPEANNQNKAAAGKKSQSAASRWPDISGIPTTPVAPSGGPPAIATDEEEVIAGIPTTPIAPTGSRPVAPLPSYPVFTFPIPDFPVFPEFPTPSLPQPTYYGQVRFLNASTNGINLDAYIDGREFFSGSTFATVSTYLNVSDGFHTVTIRRSNGQIYYQQTMAFVAGEKVTLVILDSASGVTLAKVSDMGCTNIPSGYGCLRVANMSYSGSSYDVRTFQNQIAFGGVGYKEVTSYKQAAAGNHTFFVTGAQLSVSSFNELPIIILSAVIGGTCGGCGVSNPLLTYSVNVQAGKAYTSYIIGNPWSNLYQVFTLED